MTGAILSLVAANLVMLALGEGLLPLLGLARSNRELVTRAALGYLVGLTAAGILGADLAVLDIAVGRVLLSVCAAVTLALGLLSIRRVQDGARQRPAPRSVPGLLLLGVAVAFLARAAPLFAVKPLLETDGWMIWGLRARALYDFGHPGAPVFTSLTYPALQHPLWLPALEAIDFRFIGRFDGTVVHLQLLGLAAGFVGGAWVLLRRHTSPVVLGATLTATATAPAFFGQLQTNFADVPLAMLTAVGVASLAVWLREGSPGPLAAAVLFLGAAALTKNEGEVFALAAFVSAAFVCSRQRIVRLAVAALATLAIDLPWRLWVQLHHVKIAEYSFSNLFDPSFLGRQSSRLGPAAGELFAQLRDVHSWSLLGMLGLAGLVGGLALRCFRSTAFAVIWLALSFGGLLVIYWISINPLANHLHFSSYRTVDTLVIGAAVLTPILLRVEYDEAEDGAARRVDFET